MVDKETLNKIAFDYINENITMQILADRYSLSKISVIRALSGKTSVRLDPETQEAVDMTKSRRFLEHKSIAGKKGSREPLINPTRAKDLAIDMISNGLTIEKELEKNSDISTGTLFYSLNEQNLGPELYAMLQEHYKKNRSNATKMIAGRKNK